MSEKHGIEELKELVDGAEILLLFVMQQAADGVDWSDASALLTKILTDKEFSLKLAEAFGGLGDLKKEAYDLDYKEAAQLGTYVLSKFI